MHPTSLSTDKLKAAVAEKVAEYRRNDSLSRAQFTSLLLEKFRVLARYACTHSAYYRRLSEQRGIDLATCVPTDFPILDKSTLINEFDSISTDPRLTREAVECFLRESRSFTDLLHGEYVIRQTSGSSGKRLYIAATLRECAGSLAQFARADVTEAPVTSTRDAFLGITTDHVSSATAYFLHAAIHPERDHLALDVSDARHDNVMKLNRFQPDRLSGYTSAIAEMAREQLAGRLQIRPRSICCGGETLLDADSRLIAQAFGCVPTNLYGTTEVGIMGVGLGGAVVLLEDDMMVDFQPDCIDVTSLCQFSLPLIRYRIKDALTCLPGPTVGPYRVISSQMGRSEMAMVFENDDGQQETINPLALIGLALRLNGVSRYQFVVDGPRTFTFLYSMYDALADERKTARKALIRETLVEMLKKKRLSQVTFDMIESERPVIDRRTGKASLVARAIERTRSP